MVHQQEPFAWALFIGLYTYFCFAVAFLKHGPTSDKSDPPIMDTAAWVVDKSFKIGLAGLWIAMVCLTTAFRHRFTVHTDPIVKIEYFLALQWLGTLSCVGLGVVKNLYTPWAKEDPVKQSFLKNIAVTIVALWFIFFGIWQSCFIGHAQFSASVAAMDIPACIGMAATVFIYFAYTASVLLLREDAITIVDTRDQCTIRGSLSNIRPVVGTTPGYLVGVECNWVHVLVFNLLSMYTWTIIFNDYGRTMVAIFIQQFVTMYIVHWSGEWNAFPEVFMFTTTVISQMYAFVPGTFLQVGFVDTGVPGGEYQHLQFFMDDANTANMGFPDVMYTNRLVLTSLAIIFAGGCVYTTAKELWEFFRTKTSYSAIKPDAGSIKNDRVEMKAVTGGLSDNVSLLTNRAGKRGF